MPWMCLLAGAFAVSSKLLNPSPYPEDNPGPLPGHQGTSCPLPTTTTSQRKRGGPCSRKGGRGRCQFSPKFPSCLAPPPLAHRQRRRRATTKDGRYKSLLRPLFLISWRIKWTPFFLSVVCGCCPGQNGGKEKKVQSSNFLQGEKSAQCLLFVPPPSPPPQKKEAWTKNRLRPTCHFPLFFKKD